MLFRFIKAGGVKNEAEDKKYVTLHNYFNDYEVVVNLVAEARRANKMTGPVHNRGESATCCESIYLEGRNCLLFRNGALSYAVIQQNMFCSAIYFFEERIIVSAEPKETFFGIVEKLEEFEGRHPDVASPKKFLGVILSYSRPYHFIYERIPAVIKWRDRIGSFPILSVSGTSFFSAGDLFSEVEDLRISNIQRYVHRQNGFLIDAGRTREGGNARAELRSGAEMAARLVNSRYSLADKKIAPHCGSPLVWFGLCREKRPWPEMAQAYAITICKILEFYPQAHFAFDGLTAPIGRTQIEFSSRVERERLLLQEILDRVGAPIAYFDLIGAQASDKVGIASLADYFVSSALSDANWCALLNRRPGLGYASNIALESRIIHPKTYVLPKVFVTDADDTERNWAVKGYSIEPEIIRDFAMLGLVAQLSLKARSREFAGFLENPMLGNSSKIEFGGVKFYVDLADGEELSLNEAGEPASDRDVAHILLARRYEFKSDIVTSKNLRAAIVVEALDKEDLVIERYTLSRSIADVHFGADTFAVRIRLSLSGSGSAEYFGYRAQPIPDSYLDALD